MVTDAQMRAVEKYKKENYDYIKVRLPKGKREELKKMAQDANLSMNEYILQLFLKIGMFMNKTIIKWHDYSEISNYSYKDGNMLFKVEFKDNVNGKKATVTKYLTGGLTHPDNGTGPYFRGGAISGMRIIKFALENEFEET